MAQKKRDIIFINICSNNDYNKTHRIKQKGLKMEAYDINEIVEYFRSGCKTDSKSYLGLELEHFIVDKETGKNIDYYGEGGIEEILKGISPFFDETAMSNGHVIGLNSRNIKITLEPGAQIEISIKQQKKLADTAKIYDAFIFMIEPVLAARNYEMVTLGYLPRSKVDEISLIPKDRYKYMDVYFRKSGICGRNMMRGTAATQVSIDYGSEKEFMIKYRAASILAPVLSLISDNSPVFEGGLYEKNLLRQYIWENVDYDRPMTVPSLDDPYFGFRQYAGFVYGVPQIISAEAGSDISGKDKYLPKNLYAGRKIEKTDIETILSMVFPDVRLKTYIEIRVADSMPIEYVISYMALIKGLFMDTGRLESLIALLGQVKVADIVDARKELIKNGFDGIIYGRDVKTIIRKIYNLAESQLADEELGYLGTLRDMIYDNKNLALIYKANSKCEDKQRVCGEYYVG